MQVRDARSGIHENYFDRSFNKEGGGPDEVKQQLLHEMKDFGKKEAPEVGQRDDESRG